MDAVLLDLRLPGASGLDVLRQIKAQRPEALVIVVTGYGTVQSAVQAMKHGAYEYVTKPFSIDELKLLLDRVSTISAEDRKPDPAGEAEIQAGIWRAGWARAGNGEAVSHYLESGQQLASRADSGGKRHGKGNGGALHPLLGTLSRQTFHSSRLRVAGTDADRE